MKQYAELIVIHSRTLSPGNYLMVKFCSTQWGQNIRQVLSFVVIMIKTEVFIKHKILSVHTKCAHAYTPRHLRTWACWLYKTYTQMGSKQRLETDEDSSTVRTIQQSCSFEVKTIKEKQLWSQLLFLQRVPQYLLSPAVPVKDRLSFNHFTSFPVRFTLSTDLCASWWGFALCRGRPRIRQWRCRWSQTWGSCGPAAGCETGARAAAKERLENHNPQHHCQKREEFETKASYMTL